MGFQAQPPVIAAQFRVFQINEAALGRGIALHVAAALLGEDILRQNLAAETIKH